MITKTIFTLGELRSHLEHLPDNTVFTTEEGRGLTLYYDHEPVVFYDIGAELEYPEDETGTSQ